MRAERALSARLTGGCDCNVASSGACTAAVSGEACGGGSAGPRLGRVR